MKRNVLKSVALLGVAGLLLVSCKDDNKTDDNWKQIPGGLLTAETGDAVIAVNGVPETIGSVKLTPSGAEDGSLLMMNVIPGYKDVSVDVALKHSDENTYSFSGEASLTQTPKMISLLSATPAVIYEVSVDGDVTLDGKITVNAVTRVADDARDGLAGTWSLLRSAAPGSSLLPSSYPLQVTWTAKGEYSAQAANLSAALSLLGSIELADIFNSLTFHDDGNITAEYWEDESEGDDDGGFQMPDVKKLLASLLGADGKYHFNATSHTEWISSPKANLALWYAQGGYLFTLPSSAAFSDSDDSSEKLMSLPSAGSDIGGLMEIIGDLGELGVDIKALMPVILDIAQNGVKVRYSAGDNALSLYVDKELCGPVVEALLPVLMKLDSVLEEMEKNPDLTEDEKAELQMLKEVLQAFGMEKPSDFAALWQNTDAFSIAVNLVSL